MLLGFGQGENILACELSKARNRGQRQTSGCGMISFGHFDHNTIIMRECKLIFNTIIEQAKNMKD